MKHHVRARFVAAPKLGKPGSARLAYEKTTDAQLAADGRACTEERGYGMRAQLFRTLHLSHTQDAQWA